MSPHEYLNTFTNFETNLHQLSGKAFDLSRMKELLRILGHPEKKLKIIQVAGTKGKGSTCAFLAYILAGAGHRVGLYTSPHLHRLNERIRILDKAAVVSDEDFAGSISDEQLAQAVNGIRGPIAKLLEAGSFFTYFEVLTAAALVFFSRQGLDFVILEAGLGGRLDATNAVDSSMAIVTPISLDHVNILGKTVPAIAREKAGVIKNLKQKVIIAPQPPSAMAILLQHCAELGIAPVVVGSAQAGNLKAALAGSHQRVNAAVAVEAVKALNTAGHKISSAAIAAGLKSTRWPGRFEVIQKKPTVILDGAHNADSAKALARTVSENYPGRKIIFVLGFSADKDTAAIIEELKPLSGAVIMAKASHPRAYAFEGALGVPQALESALAKAKSRGVIVVTGSLFVVASAREIMKNHVSV